MQNTPSEPTLPSRQTGGLLGRILEKPLFWVLVVVVSFGLPLAQSLRQPEVKMPPLLFQLPNFQLTNQFNKNVSLSDFGGSVLVVNFIFTSCPVTCPLLTKQMFKIQNRFIGSGPAVKFLSISVDPKNDTPEVLQAYADKFRVDHKTWQFLTGPLDQIEEIVINGFKMALTIEKGPSDQAPSLMNITHGENFVLVDQLGRIRGYMKANTDSEISEIVRTAAILANSNPHTMNGPTR